MVLISEAQERKRYISYFHKPIVQGWNTPSSSWRRWRRCWGRCRPRRQRSARVFPLRSTGPGLCFVVSLFTASSSQRRVAIFIVGFRSRRSRGRKDRRQRSHEAPEGGPHMAKESGCVGHPLLGLRPPLVCFLRSQVLFLPKTDARKFSGHLDIVWVPETSKYRK